MPGSSPLARGLRAGLTEDDLADRIIPARAGFTAPPEECRTRFPDHPRSRGVYPIFIREIGLRRGSSPLARGLRSSPCPLSPTRPDHPRSRGVYRFVRRQPRRRRGIIPARAGFTRGAPATPTAVPDHPRSRGVYSLPEIVTVPVVGSSPLARGLLHRGPQRYRRFRIIPARAGFT